MRWAEVDSAVEGSSRGERNEKQNHKTQTRGSYPHLLAGNVNKHLEEGGLSSVGRISGTFVDCRSIIAAARDGPVAVSTKSAVVGILMGISIACRAGFHTFEIPLARRQ